MAMTLEVATTITFPIALICLNSFLKLYKKKGVSQDKLSKYFLTTCFTTAFPMNFLLASNYLRYFSKPEYEDDLKLKYINEIN